MPIQVENEKGQRGVGEKPRDLRSYVGTLNARVRARVNSHRRGRMLSAHLLRRCVVINSNDKGESLAGRGGATTITGYNRTRRPR